MTERAIVPCGDCHACCRRERVVLYPEYGDDVSNYETEPAPIDPVGMAIYGAIERQMLRRKDNFDCIYLGENGCTIWERAPAMCKEFDCRKLFRKFTRAERRQFRNVLDNDVMRAGRERLHTLTASSPLLPAAFPPGGGEGETPFRPHETSRKGDGFKKGESL